MSMSIEGQLLSWKMKLENAEKQKLRGIPRLIYLQGIARLSKCEDVARKGNQGKGFYLQKSVIEDSNEKKDRKPRRKKGNKD
tara:strand:+ start:320 stop:565 length:246 start_codon:yes stop_codon:yes gene_type:complete